MTTLSIFKLQKKYAICQLGPDPFSWYKQMRMSNPISVNEQEQLYELFRYKDVQAVLADLQLVSPQRVCYSGSPKD